MAGDLRIVIVCGNWYGSSGFFPESGCGAGTYNKEWATAAWNAHELTQNRWQESMSEWLNEWKEWIYEWNESNEMKWKETKRNEKKWNEGINEWTNDWVSEWMKLINE